MLLLRKQRLILILFVLTGTAAVVTLVLLALDENLDFFYSPAAIVSGQAPLGKRIRAGGMVKSGSVVHSGINVRFVISDLQGHEVAVQYSGLLPDLFRAERGVVAIGSLDDNLTFTASSVLAKHDENYMPPEVAAALKAGSDG